MNSQQRESETTEQDSPPLSLYGGRVELKPRNVDGAGIDAGKANGSDRFSEFRSSVEVKACLADSGVGLERDGRDSFGWGREDRDFSLEEDDAARLDSPTPSSLDAVDIDRGRLIPSLPCSASSFLRSKSACSLYSLRASSHCSLASSLNPSSSGPTSLSSLSRPNLSLTLSSSARAFFSVFFTSRNAFRRVRESEYGSAFRRSERSVSWERRGFTTAFMLFSAVAVFSREARASALVEALSESERYRVGQWVREPIRTHISNLG